MSQPAGQSAGVQFEQTTRHPHQLWSTSYGYAHSQAGCSLHSDSTSGPCTWPTDTHRDNETKRGASTSAQFDAPPRCVPQPELSEGFSRWQAYIGHHVDALSHSPPHFSASLTPTLHGADSKCDMDGLCLAISLPLRAMGIEGQQGEEMGILPGHDVVVWVEVGRRLSSSPTALAFHYHVQVFTIAAGERGDPYGVRSRSSFPLACLLRYKVACLLDGYPFFFPGHALPPYPLHSFPSCVQSLVASHASAPMSSTDSKRSLLSALGEALPENPIVHVMREVESVLREASQLCVVCGDPLRSPLARGCGWCVGGMCEHALLSSPHVPDIAHALVHRRPHQLDLFLHTLIAAAIAEVDRMPERVSWREKGQWGWEARRFTHRRHVAQAAQLVPQLSELLLYDRDELAMQLNEVHPALLPLLAWVAGTYRVILIPQSTVALPAVPACYNVHHMLVSLQSKLSVGDMDHYALAFARLQQPSGLTTCDGGSPSLLHFVSAGLWALHIALSQHGLISAERFKEMNHIGKQLRSPVRTHSSLSDAAKAAAATLVDRRGGWQQPADRWKHSDFAACACVLLVEVMTVEQAYGKVQSGHKRARADAEQRGVDEHCWLVRAVFTIAAAQGEQEVLMERKEEQPLEREHKREEAAQRGYAEMRRAERERSRHRPARYDVWSQAQQYRYDRMRSGRRDMREQQQYRWSDVDDSHRRSPDKWYDAEDAEQQQERRYRDRVLEKEEEEEEEQEEDEEWDTRSEQSQGEEEEEEWETDSDEPGVRRCRTSSLGWLSDDRTRMRLNDTVCASSLLEYSIDQPFCSELPDATRRSSLDELD